MEAKKTEGAIAGVFIILEEKWWTPEMWKVARQAGKFEHPQSATNIPDCNTGTSSRKTTN